MISEAEEKDIQFLEKIIAKEFPYKKMQKEKIAERLKNQNIKIFKKTQNRKIIGFVEIQKLPEAWMLNAISIIPQEREKGYAKELLNHAIKFIKNSNGKKIILLVKKNNLRAKKIYKSAGFKFVQIHEKIIDNSIIEIWELDLTEPNSKKILN